MNNNGGKGGIGLGGLLAIAFIVLKLCGVINWAWGWVLAPIWIPVCIVIVCTIVLALLNHFFPDD